MKRTIVSFNYKVGQGVAARFYVNDLPVAAPALVRGMLSSNGGLNDRLINGDNELRIEIEWAPPPPVFRPATSERGQEAQEELRRQLSFTVFKAGPGGPDDIEVITRVVFPELWEEVMPERRWLPYHYVTTFDPGVDLYELAWVSAERVDVPCEGTVELRREVEALHAALASGDRDALVDRMRLQIEECYLAFEGNGVSVAEQLEAYDEFFANPVQVLPLKREALHFTPRAGGRVVEVSRTDGQPVLSAVNPDIGLYHASNPLFIRKSGRWRLM